MSETFEVKGAAELERALKALPVEIEKRVLQKALKAAARPIEMAAQDNLISQGSVDSGLLIEQIWVAATTRLGTVYAQIRAGGRKMGDAFYAHMVEFGTRPHEIRPKNAVSLFFSGIARKLVRHPGAKAKPFMRPAFDQKVGAALKAFSDVAGREIERIAARMKRTGR